jgi:uncharacterized protein YacL
MLLNVIRAVFVLVVSGLGMRLASNSGSASYGFLGFLGFLAISVVVLAIDVLTPRKKVQSMSAVYLGLIVGLILSNYLQLAFYPTFSALATIVNANIVKVIEPSISPLVTVVICYVCVSTLIQTKDDFRFIIPYMEFSREAKGARPLVLDTSVIIDGRIADVAEAHVLDQPLIVPRFVLQELQGIADSSDKLRRNRGRRGLDILNKLQKSPGIDVQIHDSEIPEMAGVREVDQKLVILAKSLGGKVVTNDYNLNKIAKLQGVDVINLNDLANALKPIVLPGEALTVKLIKRGEEPGQGVGYLDDGTMVVTEGGVHHLGEVVRLTVTSVLQTSAGRMIFGRLDQPTGPGPGPDHGGRDRGPTRVIAPPPQHEPHGRPGG